MQLLGELVAQTKWFILLIIVMMFRRPIIELIGRVTSGEFSTFELSLLGNRFKFNKEVAKVENLLALSPAETPAAISAEPSAAFSDSTNTISATGQDTISLTPSSGITPVYGTWGYLDDPNSQFFLLPPDAKIIAAWQEVLRAIRSRFGPHVLAHFLYPHVEANEAKLKASMALTDDEFAALVRLKTLRNAVAHAAKPFVSAEGADGFVTVARQLILAMSRQRKP